MDEAKREISEASFDNKFNSNPIETLPNSQDKINFQSQASFDNKVCYT